jgi:transposase InsO family protein
MWRSPRRHSCTNYFSADILPRGCDGGSPERRRKEARQDLLFSAHWHARPRTGPPPRNYPMKRLPLRSSYRSKSSCRERPMRYAFHSRRQTRFQQACRGLGIQTGWRDPIVRNRMAKSNGSSAPCPRSSEARIRDLEQLVWYYNHQRPHLSLHGLTPIQPRNAYFQQLQM